MKFNIGDKVIACGEHTTTIEKIEYSRLYEEYEYWFRDEQNKLWFCVEEDLKIAQ